MTTRLSPPQLPCTISSAAISSLGSILSMSRIRLERCPLSGPYPTLTVSSLLSLHLASPKSSSFGPQCKSPPPLPEASLKYFNNPTSSHLTFLQHQGTKSANLVWFSGMSRFLYVVINFEGSLSACPRCLAQ